MEKEWYTKIRGKQQGPFEKRELLRVPGISPETLVKKEKWKEWVHLKNVEELKDLFADEEKRPKKFGFQEVSDEPFEDVIVAEGGPPNYPFWLVLLIAIILTYLIFLIS